MNIASQPGSYTEIKSSVRAGLTHIIEKFTCPIFYFLAQVLANTTPVNANRIKADMATNSCMI